MDPSQSFVVLLQSFVVLDFYLVSIITILPFIFCSIALTRIMIKLNTHTADKKRKLFLLLSLYTLCGFFFTGYLLLGVPKELSFSELYVSFFAMTCLLGMRLLSRIIDENSAYIIIGILIGITAQNFLLSALKGEKTFNNLSSAPIFLFTLFAISLISTLIDHGFIQNNPIMNSLKLIIEKCERWLEG
jgi:hypothetical protein